MKITFSLLFFFFTASQTSDLVSFLKENYTGGPESFFKTMFNNFQYPEEAVNNCIGGKVTCILEINKNGDVSNIEYKNALGYGFETYITHELEQTSGKWNKANNYRKLEMTFLFNIDNFIPNETADFYFSSRRGHSGYNKCKNELELYHFIKTYVKIDEPKLAKKYHSELLDRYPNSMYLDSLKIIKAKYPNFIGF